MSADLFGIDVIKGPDGAFYAFNPAAFKPVTFDLALPDPVHERIRRLDLYDAFQYVHLPTKPIILHDASETLGSMMDALRDALAIHDARRTWHRRKRASKWLHKQRPLAPTPGTAAEEGK